jgi:PAS domain S-box-containing protein
MIQGAHYAEIRSALDTAFETGESTGVEDFAIEDLPTGEQRYLRIACHPRLEPTTEVRALSVMIVVSDVTDLVGRRLELENRLESVEEKLDDVAAAAAEERETQDILKQRLVDTNQRLIESNGELTSLNEELQTTNKQYLISNEEAQSATEEVETLNEELQATIEELNTNNEDLHARGAELQALATASETHYQNTEDSRRRLQNLLSQVPSIVAIVRGEEHTMQFINASYARLLGQPEEQLVGKPVSEVFAENKEVLELLDHVYETGSPAASETPARFDRASDGLVEDTTFDFIYQPLWTTDGVIDGVMIQGFDNTNTPPESKPNGSFPHILEEPKRLISALASMPDAVLVVDAAGESLFVNEAFEEMFGEDYARFAAYSPESGKDLAPDDTPQARASKGEAFRMEFLSRAADGEKHRFEATGRATGGDKGGVVVIREVLR